MYSTRQAATYVNMKFVTFVYHVGQGHVKEEYRLKGERMFNKAALDAFKKQYLSNAGMSATPDLPFLCISNLMSISLDQPM